MEVHVCWRYGRLNVVRGCTGPVPFYFLISSIPICRITALPEILVAQLLLLLFKIPRE
jgi:hypothetical protein